MSPRARRLASLFLVLGLVLAVVGQYYFARRPAYVWDGVFLYGLASALFLAAVRLVSPAALPQATAVSPGWRAALSWAGAHPWRALAAMASVSLTVRVGALAEGTADAARANGLLTLWLAAILLCLAAATDLSAGWARLKGLGTRLRADPREPLVILGLLLVAAATRLPALDRIPFVLGGDEASMGLQAVAVLQGRLTNPFATGWFSHPTLFAYLLAPPVRWLGAVAGLRLVPALAGTLTVPAVYLLARELFDRRVALLAAAYLAFYHYAIHYSRLGLNNMMDPPLAVLSVYCLLLGLRSRRPARFALSGVFLGLEQYFYMGSRVVPLFMLAFLGWTAWREPGSLRANRSRLLVLGGAFLVTGWPLFIYFARHPSDFMARVTQLGIFQSGWLVQASELFNRSQASLLWEQVYKSVLAFHFYTDPWVFYHPGTPLLDGASAVLFTFGLVYSMAHARKRGPALLTFWFWAVLIFGSMLLENPPSSQRLVLTVVPVSIFVAVGLVRIADVAERAFRWRQLVSSVVVAGVAAGLVLSSLYFYFAVYTPARIYGGLNTEAAYEIARYLRPLGPQYRYYLFGAPRIYTTFPTLAYLAPEAEGQDVAQPLSGPPTFVQTGTRPVFLFLPERLDELHAVRLTYPAGELREFRQPSGDLLFAAYEPSEVADERQ